MFPLEEPVTVLQGRPELSGAAALGMVSCGEWPGSGRADFCLKLKSRSLPLTAASGSSSGPEKFSTYSLEIHHFQGSRGTTWTAQLNDDRQALKGQTCGARPGCCLIF